MALYLVTTPQAMQEVTPAWVSLKPVPLSTASRVRLYRRTFFMGSSCILDGLQIVLGKPRKTEGVPHWHNPGGEPGSIQCRKEGISIETPKSRLRKIGTAFLQTAEKMHSVFLLLFSSQQEEFSAFKDCLSDHLRGPLLQQKSQPFHIHSMFHELI